MEINLNVISTQNVESTTGRKQMKLSNNASQMVFQMFTKNVYSNPIGTIVREITSNCFDSHIEAGVTDYPVLIKLSEDKQSETQYISFIDYGVGMSPDRIENIYGVYFESTKRDNNNEIGGFGIGGKTPLAYRRFTGEGEGEYDNSFFVITNFNGTKYYYTVFEGSQSPEFTLIHSESTEERNGTEIRIPVLSKDISKFEDEIKRQLLYFDGIVFEGFSDDITNDYKIIKGKSFYYRSDCFDSRMHVCLGKVYYPIDYNVLGLNSYEHNIPVAINVPIGKINVTVSREQLDYSEKTIEYLKNQIDVVKTELVQMLTKQYENIVELEDYLRYKNDFGHLILSDGNILNLKSFVKAKDINLNNFKYQKISRLVSFEKLFRMFSNNKRYGKTPPKYKSDGINIFRGSYDDFKNVKTVLNKKADAIVDDVNVYYCKTTYETTKMVRLKQSYLKNKHTRFYVVFPDEQVINSFSLEELGISKEVIDNNPDIAELVQNLYNDFQTILKNTLLPYEDVNVPNNFHLTYNKSTLSKEFLKTTIPVKFTDYNKERISIEDLIKFKGKIFYCESDDDYLRDRSLYLYRMLFQNYSEYFCDSKYDVVNGKKRNILIISMAKRNLKYMEHCKNAVHLKYFYQKFLYRKFNNFLKMEYYSPIFDEYSDVSSIFKSKIFLQEFPEYHVKCKFINEEMEKTKIRGYSSNLRNDILKLYNVDLSNVKHVETEEDILFKNNVRDFKHLEDINKNVIQFININTYTNDGDYFKEAGKFLRKVLTVYKK